MYVRHDESGEPVFVPEDGVPHRDFVPTDRVRHLDPPVRRNWTFNLSPYDASTALCRGYLESRVGSIDKAEARACRGFLKAWHGIVADGNPMSIGMAVMPAGCGKAQFYFRIHGIGPVTWLPVLVTNGNDRVAQIMREAGPDRVHIGGERDITSSPQDEDSVKRRRIPPKGETVLTQARRLMRPRKTT